MSSLCLMLIKSRGLIPTRSWHLDITAAFVDDVLVGTETEEGHDEVVEEVLR